MTIRRKLRIVAPAALLLIAMVQAPAQAAVEPFAPAGTATATTGSVATEIGIAGEATCVPGQWTQVHWYVHPFWPANYRYRVGDGIFVQWRWFASDPPWYWQGSFTTWTDIWTPPSWYTSVEFMCSGSSFVTITPL